MTKPADTYEPDFMVIDAAADRLLDGNALVREALTLAQRVPRLTEDVSQLPLALSAAELAAKSARHAAREYDQAAEALRLEVYRQSGGSVVSSGAALHNREREEEKIDKILNSFCPHLG
jgi:hypothetical protein